MEWQPTPIFVPRRSIPWTEEPGIRGSVDLDEDVVYTGMRKRSAWNVLFTHTQIHTQTGVDSYQSGLKP